MTPKIAKGLMTGNFRSWGPAQYRQASRIFSKSPYVGLEIEGFTCVPPKELNALSTPYRGLFPSTKVIRDEAILTWYRSTQAEFQILLENTPVGVWRGLSKALPQVWTYIRPNGSLHLNLVLDARLIPETSYYNDIFSGRHSDYVGESRPGVYREECKLGIASYRIPNIIRQIVLANLVALGMHPVLVRNADMCMVSAMHKEDQLWASNLSLFYYGIEK